VALLLASLLSIVPAPAQAAWVGPSAAGSVTLVGAGDIAVCGSNVSDSATALIVSAILSSDPNAIAFTAGDNVYPDGSSSRYGACYDPTWGVFKSRTRPVPGNHDYYNNPTGAGYSVLRRRAGLPAGVGIATRPAGGSTPDERVRPRPRAAASTAGCANLVNNPASACSPCGIGQLRPVMAARRMAPVFRCSTTMARNRVERARRRLQRFSTDPKGSRSGPMACGNGWSVRVERRSTALRRRWRRAR
jgi:hypothetical protein